MADNKPQIPNYLKFVFGGSAGMTSCLFTQPLDLVKNRMQMSGEGGLKREHKTSFHAIRNILKKEGFFGFYNGLSAGLFRQGTYTTLRLGLYTWMFDKFSGDSAPSFGTKAGLGLVAGGTSSFVCTPAEVGLIRMTVDGRLPAEQRRGYKSIFDVFARVGREEGVLTLWRGCWPTVVRAMVVNAAQLATYSQAKQLLLATGYLKDNIFCHFLSSMISGFVSTVCSMPVDIAKTRIQNMRMIDGKPEYRNAFDVVFKVVRQEGVFALWKGFTPYYMRLGPHTVLIFIFLEQFNRLYFKYALGIEKGRGGL